MEGSDRGVLTSSLVFWKVQLLIFDSWTSLYIIFENIFLSLNKKRINLCEQRSHFFAGRCVGHFCRSEELLSLHAIPTAQIDQNFAEIHVAHHSEGQFLQFSFLLGSDMYFVYFPSILCRKVAYAMQFPLWVEKTNWQKYEIVHFITTIYHYFLLQPQYIFFSFYEISLSSAENFSRMSPDRMEVARFCKLFFAFDKGCWEGQLEELEK